MAGPGLDPNWLIEPFEALLRQTPSLPRPPIISVAYSGGADSTALLRLCASLCQQTDRRCQAIHINHQLSEKSGDWQSHCQRQCDALGVPLRTRSVSVLDHDLRDSLETRCRDARYQAFCEMLPEGSLLLMAHHQQDQAETLLLNLFRGSGIGGLAAMPSLRAHQHLWIWRPLLGISRQQLVQTCEDQSLQWIEDPANLDARHRRNHIRHQLLPDIRAHWPGVDRTLGRCAQLMQSHDALQDALIDDVLTRLRVGTTQALDTEALCQRPRITWLPILRRWLENQQLPLPSTAQGEELVRQLQEASDDRAIEVTWPGARVSRYRQRLSACRLYPEIDSAMPATILLSGRYTVLPDPLGRLEWVHLGSQPPERYPQLEVRFASPESRIHLSGRDHSSRIRTLFQEAGISPRERRQTPRLYHQQQLICIGDLWKTDAMHDLEQRLEIRLRWFRGSGHIEYNARH